MEKKFLIVANWKANKTKIEAKRWMQEFYTEANWAWIKEHLNQLEIVIAPPFTLLDFFDAPHYDGMLAGQDISMYPTGAYTGEVPGQLLSGLGVEYCLIGHSERRKYFKETNLEVQAKMEQAINCGITPIICAQNLEEIPENIRNFSAEKYVIMYEPMEAISTEGNYHPESPEKVEATLEQWKSKLSLQCRLLYGGSVNPENVASFAQLRLVFGFVVGHASLDPETFFSIIKRCVLETTSH